jgi:hypothetical protein
MCGAYVAGKAYTRVSEQRKFNIKAVVILAVWLVYVGLLSLKRVFIVATLPPRIPLLLVMPPFLFFLYFFTNSKFKKIINAAPLTLPVYFQSFRIGVELLIFGLFLSGQLPKAATFEGYNFDIAIGITAPIIAFLYAKGKMNRALLLLWNLAGLATLLAVVFILLTYAYFPSFWHQAESILPKSIGVFPFTFLAGFLMPVAVFMHVFSIIKLRGAN